MKKNRDKVTPIFITKDSERWVPIPGYAQRQGRHRLKHLARQRANCYFARGVALGIIDFVHAAVVKLSLGGKTLIFSRGSVRVKGRAVSNRVGIRELDWDVGTSIIIPQKLNYKATMELSIDGESFTLRLMEIIVLQGLLKIAFRRIREKRNLTADWYPAMAAAIIAKGWGELERETTPAVVRVIEG